MKELLSFLEKTDAEFKTQCSSGIVSAAERFSPNRRWHIDTLLRVLIAVSLFSLLSFLCSLRPESSPGVRRFDSENCLQAGNYVRDDVVSNTIQIIAESSSLQGYAVGQLWRAVSSSAATLQHDGSPGDLDLQVHVLQPILRSLQRL